MNATNRFRGLALVLAFTLGGACGDDLQEDATGEVCQEVCLYPSEVGVACNVGFDITKIICGPDKYIAAYNCGVGGGNPGEVVPHCEGLQGGDDEAGTTTTTTGWNGAWDPLALVEVESNGTRSIDSESFDLILDDPSLLEADATVLRTKTDGTWFIAYAGELCDALGLERLDELVAINGKKLSGLAALPQLHDLLQNEKTFELDVVRGGARVILSYQIE